MIATLHCRSLLFDLDGVLVDSREAVERVWLNWARERNLDPGPLLAIIHGRRSVESIRAAAPHLNAEAEAEIIEQREVADTAGLRAIPGAAKLLQGLPADRWAVVTSGPEALARTRLGAVGLRQPEFLVSSETVSRGKPDPEPYLKAAALLGATAPNCVVVEDAPIGIRAAKAAGMRVIALATNYKREHLAAADYIVDSCADIMVQELDGTLQLRLTVR